MNNDMIDFNTNAMRLIPLFSRSDELQYTDYGLKCDKVDTIYGKFLFPDITALSRSFTYGSFVISIDGKIAFEDDEVVPLIAKNNYMDINGGVTDFWILNLLRASCDAIIIGSGTLRKEPSYSGRIHDADLLAARIENNKSVTPVTVIVSRTGRNIPYQHQIFHSDEIPLIINVSPVGLKTLVKEIPFSYTVITEDMGKELLDKNSLSNADKKIIILVTGQNMETDDNALLLILKQFGIDRALIESPTYCQQLMKDKLLDEIFINTSCIFAGGTAGSFGKEKRLFTSTEHPHAEIVSMHLHSPYFYYTRYKLAYCNDKSS